MDQTDAPLLRNHSALPLATLAGFLVARLPFLELERQSSAFPRCHTKVSETISPAAARGSARLWRDRHSPFPCERIDGSLFRRIAEPILTRNDCLARPQPLSSRA